MKAIVLGASGLVGSELWALLGQSSHYSSVVQIGRRPSPYSSNNFIKVDFDLLARYSDQFHADDLYCCMGTTLKQAGSKERFFQVDYEYVLQACTLARANGVRRLFLVSSIGADATSRNFYLSTKGKIEEAVSKLGFEQVAIFRPSFLMGDRPQFRPGEKLMTGLLRPMGMLMVGPMAKFRPVPASEVANKMLQTASYSHSSSKKIQIHYFN